MDVAIVGGTGAEGFGLALRLGRAGHTVTIGSRDADRATQSAERANGIVGTSLISGAQNESAAGSAGVVMLTVPFLAQAEMCRTIAPSLRDGAIVCDATAPLATALGGKAWEVVRPWDGSAGEQAQRIFGDRACVVAAFHTVAAGALQDLDQPIDSDVFVCGDDPEAKAVIGGLIEEIPDLRWVDCGRLSQARIAEQMTALLISVNRAYRVHGAGFRVTGRDSWGRTDG